MHLLFKLGIFVLTTSCLINFSIAQPRIVCYYTNWSVYRPGTAKFNPQNINPYLCTHLIYAFGGFTKDNQLKPFDKYQDIEQGGYAKFTGLKTYNKELKTMLAIGGWNEGSTRFSPLVASSERRSQLVKNTIKFLRQNKFDGLDLDWEYPAFRDGGKAKDRDNYAKLVQELREEFQREHDKTGRPRLLLTMAVPAGFEYIEKGYDVPKLNKHLDWFNILSYDYHSAYEPSVNHHAPLYPIEEENEYSYDTDLNINSTIDFYVKAGASREKLVLGIPTYGRSYTLFNSESNEIGAPADGPGDQGDATREKGYLAYYEICQSLKEKDSDWTVVQPNPDALGPYAYSGNQWVGYDDEDIVRKKSKFVVEQNLGGIMFWSIDNDDFRGLCNGKAYPLIEAAKETYLDSLANGVPSRNANSASKPKQIKVVSTTKRSESSKSKNSGAKFTTPPPPTTPDPGSDFKCEEEGFFAHPRDCKKYFWCLEAAGLGIVAHQFTCPSGLFFNKAADSCDYSRNVHCEKTQKTSSTSTTTEEPYTTTRFSAATVSTKAKPIYKSLSRSTSQRTTTVAYAEHSTEGTELDQEDPSVIKELIDLIKKVGGVEELERQLNLQEDGALESKTDTKQESTPSSTINKTLFEKIKNRASVLKTRPAFNGASQPERIVERSEAKEQKTTSTSQESSAVPKKYNTVNGFSRTSPQNDKIDALLEFDAVLIEKPQYTSIRRKPVVKPAVVAENDYNSDSDNSSIEATQVSNVESDSVRKYASINRSRRPQIKKVEENISEEIVDVADDELEVIPLQTTTSSKPTSKYINLSRRRHTTESPEIERDEEVVETTTEPIRRRNVTPTQKTVLRVNNNRNSIASNIQDNIQLLDTKIKDIGKEKLTRDTGALDDDDDDNMFNVIALPTESVTENIPYPENILTTRTSTTTQSPITTPPSIQVTETLIESESLTKVVEDKDDDSNLIDVEATTLVPDLTIEENGLSKQNEEIGTIEKSNSIAPRPFLRPLLSRTKSPAVNNAKNQIDIRNYDHDSTPSFSIRKKPSKLTTEKNFVNSNQESISSTNAVSGISPDLGFFKPSLRKNTRPTRVTTEKTLVDEVIESTSRPQYSYRPGYRGTARFRASTSRSGQYDRDQDNLSSNKYQHLETNRLRSLNLENQKSRPTATTKAASTVTISDVTRRSRLTTTRTKFGSTTTDAPIQEGEETTEQRIVEAKNRFNLANGERPERIRFELAVGRKIDFGFTPAAKVASKISDSDPSKVKVITGPLEKSPLVSGLDLKQGHVEEIPLAKTQTNESVTVQSFSDKLNLNEIPLNKSDIESFVSDKDLKIETTSEEDSTTKKLLLKPSKKGFVQRANSETVDATTGDFEDVTATTFSSRLRPSKIGFVQRAQPIESPTTEPIMLSGELTSRRAGPTYLQRVKVTTEKFHDEEQTSKKTRPSIQNRVGLRSKVNDENSNEDNNNVEETTAARAKPSEFVNKLVSKSRLYVQQEADNNKELKEGTAARRRPSSPRNRLVTKSSLETPSIIVENEEDTTIESTSRPFSRFTTRSKFNNKLITTDEAADDSTTDEVKPLSGANNRFTTRSKFNKLTTTNEAFDDDSITDEIPPSSGPRRFATRSKFNNKLITTDEAADDNTTDEVKSLSGANRFTTRSRFNKLTTTDEAIDDSTTDEIRSSSFGTSRFTTRSRFNKLITTDEAIDDSTTDEIRSSSFGTSRFTTKSRFNKFSTTDEATDNSTTDEIRSSSGTSRFTTRPRFNKLTTTDEAADDSTTNEIKSLSGASRFTTRSKYNETADDRVKLEATKSDLNRLALRTRLNQTNSESSNETITNKPKPSAFRSRFTTKSGLDQDNQDIDDPKTEESTTIRIRLRPSQASLLRGIKIDEVKIEEVNDLQTESPLDESTIRKTRKNVNKNSRLASPSNSIEVTSDGDDFESLDLVTEKFNIENDADDDNENEIDFTTPFNAGDKNVHDDYDKDEDETTIDTFFDTTSTTTFRTLVIRKRPLKKIDVLATRQTITEATEENTEAGVEVASEITPTSTDESVIKAKTAKKLLSKRPVINTLVNHDEDLSDDTLDDTHEAIQLTTESVTKVKLTRKLSTRRPFQKSHEESISEGSENSPLFPETILKTRPTRKLVTRRRFEKTNDELSDGPSEITHSRSENTPRSRPTRRFVTRRFEKTDEDRNVDEFEGNQFSSEGKTKATKKFGTTKKFEKAEDDSSSTFSDENSSSRPTRKKIIYERTKPTKEAKQFHKQDETDYDDSQVSETTEKLTVFKENAEETSEAPGEPDASTRKRIKVYRNKPSTEKTSEVDETSSVGDSLKRTRVFKRPLTRTEKKPVDVEPVTENDEGSSPLRSKPRFGNGQRRKIVKVNRKLVNSENVENSSRVSFQPEIESSSLPSLPIKRVYKVLKTKTPKFLNERDPIDESPIIRLGVQNQKLENDNVYNENNDEDLNENTPILRNEEDEDKKGSDVGSDQPSRPILKFPTRPNIGNRVVTIKRRPAFSLNGRSTTIHPASTRFSKDALPTRTKQVTVRKKFKPTIPVISEITAEEIEPEKKIALGERNKKIFSKGYRKSLSTTLAPNITPFTNDTPDTTDNEDDADTTEISLDNNDDNILQKDLSPPKPRFSLSRFTTTTVKPTTLHHVFAIDPEEEQKSQKKTSVIKENNADEVIKKLQKLIEINRIVEVYSKEEKLKLLKNKKLKSIKLSELTVEKPPSLETFGEISRETIIKLVKRNSTENVTEPTREPKNLVFPNTGFSQMESVTISLEGLFEREKKSHKDETRKDSVEVISGPASETVNIKVDPTASHLRAPEPLLRPESNETDPIIISLKSLDKVILSKVQLTKSESEDNETTENPTDETTLSD